MPRKGQYTKSKWMIWQQIVEGQRWALRIYCTHCLKLGKGEKDKQPYVPDMDDLMYFCTDCSLVDVQKLYAERLDTLALLDGVDNVPEEDIEEVEEQFLDSVACWMPGHDTLEARWVRL